MGGGGGDLDLETHLVVGFEVSQREEGVIFCWYPVASAAKTPSSWEKECSITSPLDSSQCCGSPTARREGVQFGFCGTNQPHRDGRGGIVRR